MKFIVILFVTVFVSLIGFGQTPPNVYVKPLKPETISALYKAYARKLNMDSSKLIPYNPFKGSYAYEHISIAITDGKKSHPFKAKVTYFIYKFPITSKDSIELPVNIKVEPLNKKNVHFEIDHSWNDYLISTKDKTSINIIGTTKFVWKGKGDLGAVKSDLLSYNFSFEKGTLQISDDAAMSFTDYKDPEEAKIYRKILKDIFKDSKRYTIILDDKGFKR